VLKVPNIALVVEPSTSLANECRSKGFLVIEDIVKNVTGYDNSADLVTCFEVLEHVYKSLGFVLFWYTQNLPAQVAMYSSARLA
jgi:hypothetical protein